MVKFQVLAFSLLPVFLFTGVAIAFQASKLPSTRGIKNSVSSKLHFHWDDNVAIETIDLTAMEKSVNSLLVSTTTSLSTATTTPELESEVLLDVSHLFLDFSVFVTANKPVLNLAQVIGRLLILAQDYLPDKHISPEELGIQVVMIATCLAKQSGGEVALTTTTTTTTSKTNLSRNETHTGTSTK